MVNGSGGVIARRATPDDGEGLVSLFDVCPMGSSIQLVMQRQPDFFAAAEVQVEDVEIVVGERKDPQEIVASFAAGRRQVYLDGHCKQVRYLSDLRIHPDCRGGTLLARGYRYLRQNIFAPGEWAQTMVLEDNRAALDLLTSGRAGLPHYVPAGGLSLLPFADRPASPVA